MFISELLEGFVEYIEIEGGRSKRTSANYALYMSRFIDFTNDMEAEQITPETVRRYRIWLNRYKNERGQELSLTTQAYHLIALRVFLKYLSNRDIDSLASDRVALPKTVRPQVTFLQSDEVERLDNQIDDSTVHGARDREMV